MIVSASYRTDIPAFYGKWFQRRLTQGYCTVTNPYGGRAYRVDLTPESVDGFVFWTRNPAPFRPVLDTLASRGRGFVIQMTITGYPRTLDRSVIDPARAVALVRDLAATYGRQCVVWRYDPVLVTDLTPSSFHEDMVERLSSALAGSVNEVVFSMATIYKKTRRNLDRQAAVDGFRWLDPDPDQKRALLSRLGSIAVSHGLTPTVCAQEGLLAGDLVPARCIDAERLSAVTGRPIDAKTAGNRPGCLCARSRDIGAYDSCPHGCVYCYAVRRPETAKDNFAAHDPNGERLI